MGNTNSAQDMDRILAPLHPECTGFTAPAWTECGQYLESKFTPQIWTLGGRQPHQLVSPIQTLSAITTELQ